MKRKPLRRQSVKAAARAREFAQVRVAVFERDGWRCVLENRHGCRGPLDPHHIVRRSQGGTDSPFNLVTLCRAHHDWVHGNPAEARQLGLLK